MTLLGSRIIQREGSTRALGKIGRFNLTLISQRHPGNKSKLLSTRYVHRSHWERLLITQKVSDDRIVLAVDPPDSSANEDLDLPERCRIVKLANSVTYDRLNRPVFAWIVG